MNAQQLHAFLQQQQHPRLACIALLLVESDTPIQSYQTVGQVERHIGALVLGKSFYSIREVLKEINERALVESVAAKILRDVERCLIKCAFLSE